MSISRLTIRNTTPSDVPLLAEMGAHTFATAFAPKNKAKDMAIYLEKSFSPAQIKKELAQPGVNFYIASQADTIIAYAKLVEAPQALLPNAGRAIELQRIYIEPAHIAKGFGGQLLQFCLQQSREQQFEFIWLGVWEENKAAIRFYEKWGFQEIGSHEFLLGEDLQTDILMFRELLPETNDNKGRNNEI